MSKRARAEDGELSSERDRAKAKRDAKWNWVNDQARFKVNIDHQRALDGSWVARAAHGQVSEARQKLQHADGTKDKVIVLEWPEKLGSTLFT